MNYTYTYFVIIISVALSVTKSQLTFYYLRIPFQLLVRILVLLWDYLTLAYMSILYVPAFPVFLILAIAENWNLN